MVDASFGRGKAGKDCRAGETEMSTKDIELYVLVERRLAERHVS